MPRAARTQCVRAGPTAAASPPTSPRDLAQRVDQLTQEVEDLKKLVHELKEQLERALSTPPAAAPALGASPAPSAPVPASPAPPGGPPGSPAAAPVVAYLPPGVTINALLDGYYEYNFNSPVGRVNYLRAYDVSSNSFSLNQADLVVGECARCDRE